MSNPGLILLGLGLPFLHGSLLTEQSPKRGTAFTKASLLGSTSLSVRGYSHGHTVLCLE
jgi:hypothetical protein